MSCYPVAEEITSICADYLVELRGFEPLTSEGARALDREQPPVPPRLVGDSWSRP